VSESFTINFLYKGIPQTVDCTLRVSAYTYQFLCRVANSDLILEKDDEGNLRAREAEPVTAKNQKPDPALIKALVEEVERILH
jgi:hypothetical protein